MELVQALTAEARAHREYLQSLYTLIAGFAGAAVVIAAALISVFNRAELKNLRKELEATYHKEASQAAEEGVKMIKTEVESLRSKLIDHESAAKRMLDDIARYSTITSASKSEESNMVLSETNFNSIGTHVDINIKNIASNFGLNFIEISQNTGGIDEEIINSMSGIIFIDVRMLGLSASTNIMNDIVGKNTQFIDIISYWPEHSNIPSVFKNYTDAISGYSSLISSLTKLSNRAQKAN